MNLALGITTTEDRQHLLERSIKSLRKAGYSDIIYIYAEPWKYKIKDKKTKIFINKERFWCFKNFNNMLVGLLSKWKKYIWLSQDDFVYTEDAVEKLKEVLEYDHVFWYYAMTTRPRMDNHIYKNWRNIVDLWWRAWGMNYVMRTDIASIMISHPFYINHLLTYTKNQQADSCVSYVLQNMELPMYYHNPTLSTHDWESTIDHIDRYAWEYFHKKIEPTMIWIASIPDRIAELEKCIESLYGQADRIVVWLNNYKETPAFLKRPWIEVVHWDNSLWDAMKFIKIDWYKGYYITCDDDLYYPKNYVKYLIDQIERYERKAIVWIHWICVPPKKIDSYYNNCYRFSYKNPLPTDFFVNVLGTGTTAFHTDTIKVSIKDFKKANMGDIWLGMLAQKQWVPMCCLRREKWVIQTMNTNWSIWESKHKDDSDITKIVNSINWTTNYLPQKLD